MGDPTQGTAAEQPSRATQGVDPSRFARTVTTLPRHLMNDAQRAEADKQHADEIEAAKPHLHPETVEELTAAQAAVTADTSKNRAAIDRVGAALKQAEAASGTSATE